MSPGALLPREQAPLAEVVTVDGPSGTGKGTLCRWLAGHLNWHLLDSGALYRLVGLAAARHAVSLEDEAGLAALAAGLDVQFLTGPGDAERITLEGEEVSAALRTEQAGNRASRVAALPAVRAALLQRQRAFRRPPGLVADGRDMGTVVFPDARLKVFLTASAEARARRRHKQLNEQGVGVNLTALREEIAERDLRDRERAVSPLKPAPDAVVLDTTGLDVQAVTRRVGLLVAERLGGRTGETAR